MIIFAFTYEAFMFLQGLDFECKDLGCKVDLIHGGGWKKLEKKKISNKSFNDLAKRKIQNINVINYYGMVEQLGLIYPSCSAGYFHVPPEAQIIIRDSTGARVNDGEQGIIQSISLLPMSYPGHSILTEDKVRKIPGFCSCGQHTDRFEFIERLRKVETRGCSDAY